LEERLGESFDKNEETNERNRGVWEGRSMEGSFFFITQEPPNLAFHVE
jgi:hypothetical protein